MKVNRVKILGKVKNLVCRILRVLSTENLIGLTSTKNVGSRTATIRSCALLL